MNTMPNANVDASGKGFPWYVQYVNPRPAIISAAMNGFLKRLSSFQRLSHPIIEKKNHDIMNSTMRPDSIWVSS